jgi:glycosyltransferase involved in cell wall biosynthesis
MWLIEALKHDHEVTVLTSGGWELAELNAYYGTEVEEDQIKVRLAPIPWPVCNFSAAALRGAFFQRCAQKVAGDYDLRISPYSPIDWSLPAIHFIADFSWHRELRERFDPLTPGYIYRDTVLRRAYLGLAAACVPHSGRDVLRDDLVIANSRWTAYQIQQTCGVECAGVIYPPVWTEFPSVSWEEKEDAFVMIGRIAAEKRIEEAITILEGVRAHGHAVRLHICGEIGEDQYGCSIAQLCRERADWIVMEGRVSGARKTQILTHCRYGIQMRSAEPFGISVAEMVKAGAIVFAPNNGGQTEILDHPDLLFVDNDDALDRICVVLASAHRQNDIRGHLSGQALQFTSTAFMRNTCDSLRGNITDEHERHSGIHNSYH